MATYRPLSTRAPQEFRPAVPARPEAPPPPPPPDPRIDPAEVQRMLEEKAREVERRVRRELESRIHELESSLPLMQEVVASLRRARKEAAAELSREVAELALALARRVVGDAVEARPEALLPVVERALQPVSRDEVAAIRLGPRWADAIRARLPGELRARVLVDESVGDGVIVETTGARVTASPGEALDRLAEALREWAEGERP